VNRLRSEWAHSLTLLREYLFNLSKSLRLSIGNESLNRYINILFASLCAAYDKMELCKLVFSNPLLEDPIKRGREFIRFMVKLSGMGPMISGESILYAIERAERILMGSRKRPFIILCDGLSLPEYAYLYDTFSKKISSDGLLYAINPGGMTKTYEYLTSIFLKSQLENVSMGILGEMLKNRFGAVDSRVFRMIDELVHKSQLEKFTDPISMASSLYMVIEDIASRINVLSENYRILLLSDHGYDVSSEDGMWYLSHKFSGEKPCLSIFSAMMIIG
jgi:hypothetical protein